jgi:hypothetical protein
MTGQFDAASGEGSGRFTFLDRSLTAAELNTVMGI